MIHAEITWIKRNEVSNLSPGQSLTKERFHTVVSKINAVLNRSPEKNIRSEPQAQPTGVSKHSPESKRSLKPLSRKETQAQSAVKNRIAVSNSSPKQNRSVATQKVTRKNSCCRLLYILYHARMFPNFPCSKNDITQPVCRRVNSTPFSAT